MAVKRNSPSHSDYLQNWEEICLQNILEKGLPLLYWATEHSDWYRGKADIKSFILSTDKPQTDLHRLWKTLPLLQKGDLRSHIEQINTKSVPADHHPVGKTTTSGSTGIPVQVGTTRLTTLVNDHLILREHEWQQRDFRAKHAFNRYLPDPYRGPEGLDLDSWGPPVSDHHQTGPATALHVARSIDEIQVWLERSNPTYLLSQPSVISALLDQMGERKPPALQEVRLFAEPFERELEERLKHQWNVTASDIYSASEVGTIAFRCKEGNQLHVQGDGLYLEVLNEQGENCQVGETGRVVITSFVNYATPLIRYDIGDYATVGPKCCCNRDSLVLERVDGRLRNMFQTPDGRVYWPVRMGVLRQFTEINQIQVIQTALDKIDLKLVLNQPLTPAQKTQIIQRLQDALSYPYDVTITPVDRIERAKSGKFEECLSLLHP